MDRRHLQAVPERRTTDGVSAAEPIDGIRREVLAALGLTAQEADAVFSVAFQTDAIWVYARRRLERLGTPLATHDNGIHVHRIAAQHERPQQ